MTDTSLETAASEMAARIIYFSRENRLGRIKRNYKYGVATLILPTAYEEQRDQTRNKFYGVWLTTEMAKDGKMLASKPISLEVQALSIHVLDEKAKKFTVGVNDSYIGCCRLSSPDEPIWYGYQYTGYDGFKPRRPGQNISTFKQKPRRYDAKDRAAKADQIVDITQTILRKALSAES
jgi:hypothetical protein